MAVSVGPADGDEDEPMSDINVVPFTDVMLVLLIVFLITTQVIKQAVPVQLPDVRYEPTPMSIVREMLEMAGVGPQDVVYDLGSGDGRMVITAAREFGARGVGIEIDPRLVERARENARQVFLALRRLPTRAASCTRSRDRRDYTPRTSRNRSPCRQSHARGRRCRRTGTIARR